MYKLLIVEDEFLLRSELALCEDWASMGFEPPLLAENGRQGLAIALAGFYVALLRRRLNDGRPSSRPAPRAR